MKITFLGAAGEVTGSCYLVETAEAKFLVDCGMFQGDRFVEEKNYRPFPFDPRKIDFVLLTHAHLDHSGRLPKLGRDGFSGKIICTAPTRDFAEVILEDSAHVISDEAMRREAEPLYSMEDVERVMRQFEIIEYGQGWQITGDVRLRFRDAGHILGSAMIEVWIKENGVEKKIVFSGDLGNPPVPLLPPTELIDDADFLVIESTYGNREHEPAATRLQYLRESIIETVSSGGVLMIPALALERAQELLYEMNELVENKKIPPVPIFVDSPLAIKATSVYRKYVNLYNQEAKELLLKGDSLFTFPGLAYARTKDDSKSINDLPAPKVIIAGSGMCNGGRITHHLRRYLGDPKSEVLIISYQVAGSLGRQLRDHVREVVIEGEAIRVNARVRAIGAYSSHADQGKLIHWLNGFQKLQPRKVFITHGEPDQSIGLAKAMSRFFKFEVAIPKEGEIIEI